MNFLKIIAVWMVVFGAIGFSHAAVIHNTLDPGTDAGNYLIYNSGNGQEAGGKFEVSGNDYYLDSIEMRIKDTGSTVSDAIWLYITGHDSGNNVPSSTMVLSETRFEFNISDSYTNVTFDPLAAPVLYAGDTYWLVASVFNETDTFTYNWNNNKDYGIASQLAIRNDSGDWESCNFYPFAFKITGTVVPIPGTIALLASGLIGIVVFRKKFRKS